MKGERTAKTHVVMTANGPFAGYPLWTDCEAIPLFSTGSRSARRPGPGRSGGSRGVEPCSHGSPCRDGRRTDGGARRLRDDAARRRPPRAAHHRRTPGRSALPRRRADLRLHPGRAPGRVAGDRAAPSSGLPSTDDHVYVSFRCWESRARPAGRQGDAARQRRHLVRQRQRRVHLRHLQRQAQRLPVHAQFHRRTPGRPDRRTSGNAAATGTRSGTSRSGGSRADGASETAIPFKSLRYRPGDDQIWGFNAFRTNRWKNELSFLKPTYRGDGQRGLLQFVDGGDRCVGLEVAVRRPEPRDQAVRDLERHRRIGAARRDSTTTSTATSAST